MAFSVLVGNMIGANKVRETQEYVKLAVASGVTWGLLCTLVMIIFR